MRPTPIIQNDARPRGDRTRVAQSGFSLVELVLVIVLIGIIASVGAQLMGTGFQMYVEGRDSLSVDAQARLALERITRELRAVRKATGLTLAPATELNFTGLDGTAVRYCMGAVGGCPGAAGELMRNAQVLAGGISGLSVVYTDSAGAVTAVPAQVLNISIQFTAAQGGISTAYRATVSPRN